MEFAVIERKEVLHEGFAALVARFHQLKNVDINDSSTEQGQAFVKAKMFLHDILDAKYATMDDITTLKNEYTSLKEKLDGWLKA